MTEKIIGGVVMVLLIAMGVGIAFKGARYDVTRYTGDITALETTREAVEGKAATLRMDGDLRGSEMRGRAAVKPDAGELAAFVGGLSPLGATEHYNPDTLFEKINGRAPAYLEFSFVELTSRSFTIDAASGDFIDVFLFRHDSPLNAFGIFSLERGDAGTPLDFVADGYRGGNGLLSAPWKHLRASHRVLPGYRGDGAGRSLHTRPGCIDARGLQRDGRPPGAAR